MASASREVEQLLERIGNLVRRRDFLRRIGIERHELRTFDIRDRAAALAARRRSAREGRRRRRGRLTRLARRVRFPVPPNPGAPYPERTGREARSEAREKRGEESA